MADKTLHDPLGRAITLHDSTWFGHVMKRHPEMRTLRGDVERALAQPIAICFSRSEADSRIYFGSCASSGNFVAVVANAVGGFVKTAYRANRVKGVVEWSPPTP